VVFVERIEARCDDALQEVSRGDAFADIDDCVGEAGDAEVGA